MMGKTEWMGLIRHALTFAAGYIVSAGILPNDEANAAVGGMMALIGVAWSYGNKQTQKEEVKRARAMPAEEVND